MPRELRISISATIPIPENGSAFDDARLILSAESAIGELGNFIVIDADGRFAVTANVVTLKNRNGSSEPPAPVPDLSDVLTEENPHYSVEEP